MIAQVHEPHVQGKTRVVSEVHSDSGDLGVSGIAVFVLLISMVVLHGCATSYASSGVISGGYKVVEITPNTFNVEFDGHVPLLKDPYYVTEYALYKSAELALARGYSHF